MNYYFAEVTKFFSRDILFHTCSINSIQRKKLPQVDNNHNIFLSEGLRLRALPMFVELFLHVFDT